MRHERPDRKRYNEGEDGDSNGDRPDYTTQQDTTHRKEYRVEKGSRPHTEFRSEQPVESTAVRPIAEHHAGSEHHENRTWEQQPHRHPVVTMWYDHKPLLFALAATVIGSFAAIAWLMLNLSSVKNDFLSERQKAALARQAADDRIHESELAVHTAQDAATKRAIDLQAANDFAAQSQKLAIKKDEDNHRAISQQLQSLYVTQIRLAKQAFDQGNVSQVLQLLEPYRTDPNKQGLRSFAWYYLSHVAHAGGSQTLRGHSDTVRQASFTPDGAKIVTFGDDGMVMYWDTAKGQKIQGLALDRPVSSRNPNAEIEQQLASQAGGFAIGPHGEWAAAYGPSVYIGTNIAQPDQAHRLSDHTSPVISLALSRDGTMLATGDYQGEIIVHELASGKVVRHLRNVRPLSMCFSPDAHRLMVGMHDGGVFVWEVGTGALLGTAAFGDGITSIAVSPDGQTVALALAVRDGVVKLWEPATGKLRVELRGHHDQIEHVAFSPDGKSLVTASRDQTACLWTIAGGLIRTFKGHLGEVETAAFSPDGQKIVTGSTDRTAILWNQDGGQPFETLADTPAYGWISSINFSPGGDQVLGAGSCETNEAFLSSWNLAAGNRPTSLQTSSKVGTAMAISPNGKQLTVGESTSLDTSARSQVRIWNLDPNRIAATLPKLTGHVNTIAYSPDGRFVAAALGDLDEKTPGTVKIMESATGVLRQTLPDMAGKVEAAFSGDGTTLVTVTGSKQHPGQISLWNSTSGQLLGRIDNPKELESLITMALSPDGRYLVTGHGILDRTVSQIPPQLKLWDLTTRQLLGVFPAAHQAAICRIVFSRRGALLASGDVTGNVRIWDFPNHKLLPTQIPSQGHPITDIAFDHLGDRVATASDEKCIRVWHIDTARQLAIMELSLGAPAAVRFSPDGKSIIASTSAGGLFSWEADNYRPLSVLRAEGNPAGQSGHAAVVTCSSTMPPDGRLLTGSLDKSAKLWDIKSHKFLSTAFTFNESVSCLAVSPDGRRMAIGTGRYRKTFAPGELDLFELGGQGPAQKVLMQGDAITSVAFGPDGNTLAVCTQGPDRGQGPTLTSVLLNLSNGMSIPLAAHWPQCAAFTADGRLLALGCANGEIDIWPIDSTLSAGSKPGILQGHHGAVGTLSFSPDGKSLASGGADNNVMVWDVATGADLLTLPHNGSVEAVRFSPDGQLLATADREALYGGMRLWRAPIADAEQGYPPAGNGFSPAASFGPASGYAPAVATGYSAPTARSYAPNPSQGTPNQDTQTYDSNAATTASQDRYAPAANPGAGNGTGRQPHGRRQGGQPQGSQPQSSF